MGYKSGFFPNLTFLLPFLTSANFFNLIAAQRTFPIKKTLAKKFILAYIKKPDLVVFHPKNSNRVQKTSVFDEKTPKPKSFSKNPRSREKTPGVGTLMGACIFIIVVSFFFNVHEILE